MVRFEFEKKAYIATSEDVKTDIGKMCVDSGELFGAWFRYMSDVQNDFSRLIFEEEGMHLHSHKLFWEFIRTLSESQLDRYGDEMGGAEEYFGQWS